MSFAILAFCCIFLLVASAGLLLFHRQDLLQRIAAIVAPRRRRTLSDALQQTSTSIGVVVEKFERVIPKSSAEVSVVQQRLIQAGYRKDAAVNLFYGGKVVTIAALCAVVTFTELINQSPFIFYAAAIGLGYLGPDFWLGKMISSRQSKIRTSLPDVLDLLVICVEAGLGLDQAVARTAQELRCTHPIFAEELDIVVLEQRAGLVRADAWRHLAERTGVDVVRNFVSILVQSEQFGTSIAKTLRTHSDTIRTQRIQTIEELAAKTTIKLIFPLVLFIFPCLFLVTLGPAVILMSESFKNFLGQ